MRIRSLTVKELSAYIGQSINQDQILKNIQVEGEISNLKHHSNGNLYFSLKDDRAKINCIMFENYVDARLFSQKIADGSKVVCTGSVNYYDKEGYINLIVNRMERVGEGEAYRAFLELKQQLMEEGLFDPAHKKELPSFARKIGIVTSPTGAVIRDIYRVIARRYPKVELLVYPARVQGPNAPEELIAGVTYFEHADVDLVILARGGGSYEELSAFNDEGLARTVFHSSKPIISAVGHETDFTIADFVADVRASTPSVAAELAVPQLEEVIAGLYQQQEQLQYGMQKRIEREERSIERRAHLIELQSPERKIHLLEEQMQAQKERMSMQLSSLLQRAESLLQMKMTAIFLKNPSTVYDMGGAYITDNKGHKITSASGLCAPMELSVVFADGQVPVEVKDEI